MQAQQILRDSMEMEALFKVSQICIKACKTIGKYELTNQDAACLQNCGYNFMFVKANMPIIMQGVNDKFQSQNSDI